MTTPPRVPDTRATVSDDEIDAGVICMMCGVAGSGKTTLARQFEARGMARLSIDEEIWSRFGRYGLDYPVARYEEFQVIARRHLDQELIMLLRGRTPAVLDYSFWKRADRDRYRALIERHQRPHKLIVLRVPPDVVRRRLAGRSYRCNANAAVPIDNDLFDTYARGFEWPSGEGEIDVAG